MKNWQPSTIGFLAGLGSGGSFAIGSLAAKAAYDHWGGNPWALVAYGSVASFPLLLPWARGMRWRAVLPAGLVGALSMLFYNIALARLDLSLAVIFAYTFPAWALLLVWWAHRTPPGRWQVSTTLLCLAGVAVVSGPPGDWAGRIDPIGLLCALGAAITHAAYGVLGARFTNREGVHAVVMINLLTLGMTAAVAPMAVWHGAPDTPLLWLAVLLTGIFGRILPMWLFSTGSRLAGPGAAAIAATVELPLSLLIGLLFLGDRLSPVQWGGAALVIAAIVLSQVKNQRRESVAKSRLLT